MKQITVFFISVLLSVSLKAQEEQVEILLLGTQHQFQDTLVDRQDFEKIREKLIAFSPEIICIESIPADDYASLKAVRSNQLGVAGQLINEKQMNVWNLDFRTDSLTRLLTSEPNNLLVRSHLANHFYAKHDFWNAYYHYFILTEELKNLPQNYQDDSLKQSFALNAMHERIHKRHINGEYARIVFPLAHHLGMVELKNIDYRAEEKEFLKRSKRAIIGTLFNLKIFKLKKVIKDMKEGMQKAEEEGRLITHINSKGVQETYVDLIDNAERYLKSKNMRRVVKLWEWRNQVMAERILKETIESGAKRVLVTFGAFHVPFVKRYLENIPEVKVITYDQLVEDELIIQNPQRP